MSLFLGLDLGGTQVRAVAAEVTSAEERPGIVGDSARATPASGRPDDVITELAMAARQALEAAGRDLHDVVAVGCAAPGPLDHRSGLVHVAPNIPGFVRVPLAERLSVALDGVPVFVDRDTVIAAIGEGLAGAARGSRDYVYVTVSTGVGGAIVSGGSLLRGATDTAGEIGHLPVQLALGESPPACGCGSFGCVEAFAGGRNLAQRYGSASAHEVFDAARRGDARALRLVFEAESALGALGIALVNGINPAVIVVGGSIAEYEPQHVLEPLRRAIRERAFAVAATAVRVVPAHLGADVGMVGAVLSALERSAGRGEWFA